MAEQDPRYRVQSVERAVAILRILELNAGRDGLSLQVLTQHMGMSKSSVLSTVHTLVAAGMVTSRTDGSAPRYKLGLGLVRLGQAAAEQTSVGDFCRPELEALSAATGLTARVAVPEGPWAVAVTRIDSPNSVRLDLRLGEREWPHRSGLGKAIMSALPDDEILSHLATVGMPRNTVRTIVTPEAFLEEISLARTRGFSMDDEEDAEGIMCIASPILDRTGRPFAAISVTGLKAGPSLGDPLRVSGLVKDAAVRLSSLIRGD